MFAAGATQRLADDRFSILGLSDFKLFAPLGS